MLVKIFFSYAHEDKVLLDKLQKHLKPLQREGLIEMWHDRDISAGMEWKRESVLKQRTFSLTKISF